MNNNNYFTGTYRGFETTMDSSFYSKNKYRNDMSKLQVDDNFDDGFEMSPPSSSSNMNFFNAGTGQFRRRLNQNNLNFDAKRGSKKILSGARNLMPNNFESGTKVPNINRNKASGLFSSGKGDKPIRGKKGGSTSRNMPVNQSYNQIPSIKQQLNMNDPDFSLPSYRNMNDGMGLNHTLDVSAPTTSRKMFASPRNDANGIIYNLQRQVNDLKAMLADSQAE